MTDKPLCINTGFIFAEGIRKLYADNQTDYNMEPIILCDNENQRIGRIKTGDAVIFCCRRGEREIQLTEAFTDPDYQHFNRIEQGPFTFSILTLYHEKFKDLPVAFAPSKIKSTLAESISNAGLKQLHISESEKFAHVTFFLNGGNNSPFPFEEDVRIPSPRGIPYEQVPEMHLEQVAQAVKNGLRAQVDFIVTNFANGDVIGHTANTQAKIKCAEAVDKHLKKVVESASEAGYLIFITADHGNLETLYQEDGSPHVSHTTNQVPFVIIDPIKEKYLHLQNGKLADIAPTILYALKIPQPSEMTGENLLKEGGERTQQKILLIILDGWGIGLSDETNPIYLANTPYWDHLLKSYTSSMLEAAGSAVGLKKGKAGNSEAGHLNIGAGRVVLQDDMRLEQAMKDGSFFKNEVFNQIMDDTLLHGNDLHLIGLLTEKSSHGSIDYPIALLKLAKEKGIKQVYLHLILDGRSTEPGSAPDLLLKTQELINEIGLGLIVTSIGRGIALDRDGNYERTEKAFNALTSNNGHKIFIRVDEYGK